MAQRITFKETPVHISLVRKSVKGNMLWVDKQAKLEAHMTPMIILC